MPRPERDCQDGACRTLHFVASRFPSGWGRCGGRPTLISCILLFLSLLVYLRSRLFSPSAADAASALVEDWTTPVRSLYRPSSWAVSRYKALSVRRGSRLAANCFSSPYTDALNSSAAVSAVSFPLGSSARRKWSRCVSSKATLHARYSDERCPRQGLCMVPAALPLLEGRTVTTVLELGSELLVAVPWVYGLAVRGTLAMSFSVADSRPFYFGSPRHCEGDASLQRRPLSADRRGFLAYEGGDESRTISTPWPLDGSGALLNGNIRAESLPAFERGADWMVPPFRAHFCGSSFWWFSGMPYIVVLAKRSTSEWNGDPVHSISDAVLARLYDVLAPHYIVVYHRALPGMHDSELKGFNGDRSDLDNLAAHARRRAAAARGAAGETSGGADKRPHTRGAALSRAAGQGDSPGSSSVGDHLALLPDLIAAARRGWATQLPPSKEEDEKEMSPNELLLATLADADGIVTVQGGPSYVSLMFTDTTSIIYQRRGEEVEHNAADWFGSLSASRAIVTADEEDIPRLANEAFVVPLAEKLRTTPAILTPTLERENAAIFAKRDRWMATKKGE